MSVEPRRVLGAGGGELAPAVTELRQKGVAATQRSVQPRVDEEDTLLAGPGELCINAFEHRAGLALGGDERLAFGQRDGGSAGGGLEVRGIRRGRARRLGEAVERGDELGALDLQRTFLFDESCAPVGDLLASSCVLPVAGRELGLELRGRAGSGVGARLSLADTLRRGRQQRCMVFRQQILGQRAEGGDCLGEIDRRERAGLDRALESGRGVVQRGRERRLVFRQGLVGALLFTSGCRGLARGAGRGLPL
jgi:hypothetical protein